MQNTKNTILVIVIVVLFAAAGLVIYRGFFASEAIPDISVGVPGAPVKNVMPYGSTLDFSRVQQRASTADTYRYEVVDAAVVGVAVQNLIASPSNNSTIRK
ncbi:MAG: hypothetical protein KBD66_02000 [Candidatus Doudnabacteria bacterium]|nr:hypothetical protein [Candidatus Doudnabacteria bacterium]